MSDISLEALEAIQYEVRDGVGWITLNRPEVLNAFNYRMQQELHFVWRNARHDNSVRCLVLTGAGDRAFCTGIDRDEAMGHWQDDPSAAGHAAVPIGGGESDTPWHFDDPGELIGPKSNDLWKPVIAAVNGMACGGAFYMLGEVEFIIASDNATFFDPHVTFGMTACFESMHMLQKMPFHEIMRTALMGSHERISAQRAYEIGLVSEVVPLADLHDTVALVATTIAAQPAVAVQGTVRSLWAALDMDRKNALDFGKILIRAGSDPAALAEGQQTFASGQRTKPRIR